MGTNLIPNILAGSLFIIGLYVALRAFYVYSLSRSPRLFILGLSMGIISLTAGADFASSNITSITLNTDWFLYIGQAISLLFILLSLVRSSDKYLQGLTIWHLGASGLLLALLLLSPTLPGFPNTAIRAILSSSRCILCFGIFFCYVSAFMKKETRFGLLMSLSFLLLALGYLMIAQQYFTVSQQLFDNAGDIIRLLGLGTLLAAVLAG